jgi:hypothetical protein
MSVTDAARSGTRADLLSALRWRLEQTFFAEPTPHAALVSLSKALEVIVSEQAGLVARPRSRRLQVVDDE